MSPISPTEQALRQARQLRNMNHKQEVKSRLLVYAQSFYPSELRDAVPNHINRKGIGSKHHSAPFHFIPLSERAERLMGGRKSRINERWDKRTLGAILKNKELEVRLGMPKKGNKRAIERQKRVINRQKEGGGGTEQSRYFTRSMARTQNGTKSSGSNSAAPTGGAEICVTRMKTRSQRRRELGIKEEPMLLAEGIAAGHAPAVNEGQYQLVDQHQHSINTGMSPVIHGAGTMAVQAPIIEGQEQSGNQYQRNYNNGMMPVIKREREDGYPTTSLLSQAPVATFAESSIDNVQIPAQPYETASIPDNPICSYLFGPQASPLFDRPNMPAQYGPVMRAVEIESLRKQNCKLMQEVQELSTRNTNLAEENVDLKMKLVRYEELLLKSVSIISKS